MLDGPSDVEVQAGEVASFTCKASCDRINSDIIHWHKAGFTRKSGHLRVLRNNSFGDMTIRMQCENGVRRTSVLTITASEELNQSSFQCIAIPNVDVDDGDDTGTCYSRSALLTGKQCDYCNL